MEFGSCVSVTFLQLCAGREGGGDLALPHSGLRDTSSQPPEREASSLAMLPLNTQEICLCSGWTHGSSRAPVGAMCP